MRTASQHTMSFARSNDRRDASAVSMSRYADAVGGPDEVGTVALGGGDRRSAEVVGGANEDDAETMEEGDQ
jgi:hypothetical protein